MADDAAAARRWRGMLAGALLYVAMLVFTLLNFAFSPSAWERAEARVFGALFALLPAFLLAGLAAGSVARLRARVLRYAMTGTLYGAPVAAFFATALPLTAPSYVLDSPTRLGVSEAALWGAGLGFAGGLLLALLAAFRQRD